MCLYILPPNIHRQGSQPCRTNLHPSYNYSQAKSNAASSSLPCDSTNLAFPTPDIPHSFYAQETNDPVLN